MTWDKKQNTDETAWYESGTDWTPWLYFQPLQTFQVGIRSVAGNWKIGPNAADIP